MSSSPDKDSAVEQLLELFRRCGYVRRQNPLRLEAEGYMGYKKGDEIRFIVASRAELIRVQRLLRRAGFEPGRPFVKGRQFVLPVYGRAVVQQFLSLFHEPPASQGRL